MTICQIIQSLWPNSKSPFKTSLEINEKIPAFDDDDSSSSLIFSFKKKRPPCLPSDAISRGQYVPQPRPPKGNVVTQRHYGITLHTRFNEKIHREEEKCWNSFEERWDAGNQIEWLIRKSVFREIDSTTPFPLYQNWHETGPTRIRLRVHAFEGRVPPTCLGSADSMADIELGETILDTLVDICGILQSPTLVSRINSAGVKYNQFHHHLYISLTEKGKVRVELRHNGTVFFSKDMDQ